MIRPATLDDVSFIVNMGEIFHKESPRWSRINYNKAKAAEMISNLISNPNGLVLVATQDKKIIGGIAAIHFQHWSSDDWIVDELSFFMLPEHRGSFSATKLICSLKAWANIKGAAWVYAGTSTGVEPERTAQLYERLGFKRCSIGLEC